MISELLSGTVQSAETAAQMVPELEITVIDSRNTSLGLGFQVIRAAEMAVEGKSREDIIQEVVRIRSAVKLFFAVDNLEYLVRGGRLSKTGGLLGTLLQVKPILGVNDGRIEAVDKVRTKARAVEQIIRGFEEQVKAGMVEKVGIGYVDNLPEALEMQKRIKTIFEGPVYLSEAGPVVGSHTGPGAIGLIYY